MAQAQRQSRVLNCTSHLVEKRELDHVRQQRRDPKGQARLDASKLEFATTRKITTLQEAIKGADVFVGLSVADILTPEDILSMAKTPSFLHWPIPIRKSTTSSRKNKAGHYYGKTAVLIFLIRSNNVLGFPYIFRGALDVRATEINEAMKLAAVHALADLAKEPYRILFFKRMVLIKSNLEKII